MSSPVIQLDDVSFSYGETLALQQVNLSVEAGDFLGIVGPNAGGKSTLLKLILGLLEPQAGRVLVLGKRPPRSNRAIGYVPQYPRFARDFPISVEQAVLMGRLSGRPGLGGYRRTDHQAAQQALAEVEAAGLAKRRIGTLSGGQLQRVLLARALVCEPQILILDEPTANVDLRLESDIFDLLRQLNQRMTILVVSHDIAFISSYVSRVACLNRSLVCHHTDKIDGQLISELYGEDVRMVAHRH
ncbi:metal ABC transporter ATP-binding protein [Candidatus Endoriftia persephone]|jgi:zinc transport system ATP-binding protein|uniref:Zinc ABC transporter, ATP-binding protein ZnuC n=3 Tax=Gammaproteobacteria TaxID=1236 RepID=G2FI48_9GAMM|nr:ABC transporter ATP-binding protein [Candidatus Endoriftia persephone]EGV51035.1 zinc ABC transporter, ATP-binding protein ZnuC [endosymbiont of Riftia pachyptila (vent Ph05)]EGW53557.1 zinc ABC transporter, ATP-binding protein ZnuC [endosymbiont of Tevnia jerichonana (vent Tica)]USF86836.1 ABC transporter ATP-binding protein [Candidatus Endoriftia persephone]